MLKIVATLSVAVEENERLALALLNAVKLDVHHIFIKNLRIKRNHALNYSEFET